MRVASGNAARWSGLRHVVVSRSPREIAADARDHEVEATRAYGDRLVLKLRAVDDVPTAKALTGHWIWVEGAEVPPLPEGTYYVERLVGLVVDDEAAGRLGRVEDVLETGGVDLLVVRGVGGEEILVPLAREIVVAIDESSGRVRVRLPEGLLSPEP